MRKLRLFLLNKWAVCKRFWIRFWMPRSGLSISGRLAMKLASLVAPEYKSGCHLSKLGPAGYISPSVVIKHSKLQLTRGVYLGDRTIVYESGNGGPVVLEEGVHLYGDVILETGVGGAITIGEGTHVQPRCSISAYKGSIMIGKRVEIAPNCAFYPYNHAMAPRERIRNQPLVSKGDIVIEDDVWLGFGTIILEGVRIGAGAVVGAGSVVTKDVPAYMIAVGNPARIIGSRKDINPSEKSNL